MLSFLSQSESSALLKLFGTDTEAGRHLRRMLAPTQQQSAAQIRYPKPRKRDPTEETKQPAPRKPLVRYPKMRKVKAPAVADPLARPSRRPANLIRSELDTWTPDPLPEPKKDMSAEKSRLQESLQFVPSRMLPESVVGCTVEVPVVISVTPPVRNRDKALIAQILEDVAEAQSELDTATDVTHRRALQRRIDEGIKDLKLLSKTVS